MTTDQEAGRIAYPALPNPLNAGDLARLFKPTSTEIDWASEVTTSAETRHGLLTLLKIFQTLGRFIQPTAIPSKIVRYVALHARLPEANEVSYRRQTLYRHHALIREFVGVCAWNADARQLVENTIEQLALTLAHPADLLNGAIDLLIRKHFELPALSTLRRIAGNVQQRVHDHLFREIQQRLSAQDKAALDALNVPDGAHESPFAALCRSPGRATRKNLGKLIDHWYWLQSLLHPKGPLVGISPAKIEHWSDEGLRLTAPELTRYRAPRRHALLLSVLCLAHGRVLDDLVNADHLALLPPCGPVTVSALRAYKRLLNARAL